MFIEILSEAKDYVVFRFRGETMESLENKIWEQFYKDGYKKLGHANNILTVEKGSYAARLFLGAFYKYFKWEVRIVPENDDLIVTLHRQSSGMSGGLIGVNQVKNELLRLKGIMSNW